MSQRPTADRRTWTNVVDGVLWALSAVWLGLVVWFSLGARPEVAGVALPDKLLHALAYAVLTILLLLAGVWRPGRGPGPLQRLWPVVLGVPLLGIGLEVVQEAAFRRDAEALDVIANVGGVAAALALWAGLRE